MASLVSKGAMAFLSILALFPCSSDGHSQEPLLDRESYYRAVDFCRRDGSPSPMVLSPDKQILCFSGVVSPNLDVSLAKDLEQNGLFAARSPGGNGKSAIELSNLLRDRHATVVVYDHCFSACAMFFLIASHQAYVLKDTLVAWHYPQSSDPFHPYCTNLTVPRDGGPRKLQRGLCNAFGDQVGYGPFPAETQFFKDRTVDARFEAPPDSQYVRRIVSSIFAESGVYRDIAWTIHPRFYPRLFKTKIVYEAYPESQSEVDNMLARLNWNIRVIYDP